MFFLNKPSKERWQQKALFTNNYFCDDCHVKYGANINDWAL